MSNATHEHPSAQEWKSRQAAMPAGMRDLIDAHREGLDATARAEQARRDGIERTLRDRLAAFEVALRDFLAGADWLFAYRVAVPAWAHKNPFGIEHAAWEAEFDLTPVGCWPVRVALSLSGPYSAAVWTPMQPAPFAVMSPSSVCDCDTLDAALFRASQWTTPF